MGQRLFQGTNLTVVTKRKSRLGARHDSGGEARFPHAIEDKVVKHLLATPKALPVVVASYY